MYWILSSKAEHFRKIKDEIDNLNLAIDQAVFFFYICFVFKDFFFKIMLSCLDDFCYIQRVKHRLLSIFQALLKEFSTY